MEKHEWKRSFPRIMRGPRGVGFQENADCFPASPFSPSYFQFSIRLSFPSPPLPFHAINLRLRQQRRCISPLPPPPRFPFGVTVLFICVRAWVFTASFVPYRPLNTPLSRGTNRPVLFSYAYLVKIGHGDVLIGLIYLMILIALRNAIVRRECVGERYIYIYF